MVITIIFCTAITLFLINKGLVERLFPQRIARFRELYGLHDTPAIPVQSIRPDLHLLSHKLQWCYQQYPGGFTTEPSEFVQAHSTAFTEAKVELLSEMVSKAKTISNKQLQREAISTIYETITGIVDDYAVTQRTQALATIDETYQVYASLHQTLKRTY